jgi:hypothetical protein
MLWAKSLPSKNNSLDLRFDLYPTSKTEPCFQFLYFCGGAFVHRMTAKLKDRDYRPVILTPREFKTGFVTSFVSFPQGVEFSLVCFAKSDVIVRRHYVWGLKSRYLETLEPPWRQILEKGRSGVVPRPAAA